MDPHNLSESDVAKLVVLGALVAFTASFEDVLIVFTLRSKFGLGRGDRVKAREQGRMRRWHGCNERVCAGRPQGLEALTDRKAKPASALGTQKITRARARERERCTSGLNARQHAPKAKSSISVPFLGKCGGRSFGVQRPGFRQPRSTSKSVSSS